MLEPPEFEDSWYAKQNAKMEARYGKIFKKWKLSWDKYYSHVQEKLRYNNYWLWVYLCGFEKFVQETHDRAGLVAWLKKDQEDRIRRIIGKTFEIQEYIRTL
jgi:hypothetical protein